MKRRFLFVVIIIGIMAISSVRAQFRIGPGIGHITETKTLLLSANANYDLPKNFGVEANYSYIFAKTSGHKWWGADLDGTYTFVRENKKGELYVLAGLNILHNSYTGYTHSFVGGNIGAGWRVKIGSNMELVPEITGTFGDLSYLRVGLKFMFCL